MQEDKVMKTSDFYYDLPKELIAQDPLVDRASSRLLHLDRQTGEFTHEHFRDIKKYLKPNDTLVINDTRVIPGAYSDRPQTGYWRSNRGAYLLTRKSDNVWETLVKPGKKMKPGAKVTFGDGLLNAEVLEVVEDGNRLIRFDYEGIFEEILDQLGEMPLPPYITHKLKDKNRYQTVYAKNNGSAAAPFCRSAFYKRIVGRDQRDGCAYRPRNPARGARLQSVRSRSIMSKNATLCIPSSIASKRIRQS